MNQKQKKRLIRNAEHVIAALGPGKYDEALAIALRGFQVFLSNKVALTSDAHLQSVMAELANRAIALDAQRAGETS